MTETCADDFATIRARMEELRREVERGEAGQTEARSDLPLRPHRSAYWLDGEVGAGPNGDCRSGPTRGQLGREELVQWQTVAAAKAKDRWELRACGR